MSISKTIRGFGNFVKRKPLIFNSLVYGTFYTSAEFARQTFSKSSNVVRGDPEVSRHMQRSSFKEPVDSKGVFRWMEKFNRTLGLDQDSQCSPEDYNWSQLRRYTIYGCALAGPLLYGWYRWLDATYTGTSTKIVLKKLFVDQFILTPPLIMLFFVSMSLMEGRASVLEECKSKFVKTFRTSCLYWIPVQFMNFLLVPPSFRVLYVSVASFCWVNILCYLKSLPANRDEPMQGSST